MSSISFDDDTRVGSDQWQQAMAFNGNALKKSHVGLIVLVHGTFAGDDGFGLFDLVESINNSWADTLKDKRRTVFNELANDVGNYTPDYASCLEKALGIRTQLYIWGSGNFHFARLKGVLGLANELASQITQRNLLPNNRILIIGHSHAGQLFALLTTFLANQDKAHHLFKIMEDQQDFTNEIPLFVKHLQLIQTLNLDFVTFGTPVRYSWGAYGRFRLMAVINHRYKIHLSGLMSTRDGDYIERLGVEGSDILPPIGLISANDAYDAVLDKGRDLLLLKASMEHDEQRHPQYVNGEVVTETILVDYKDNAPFTLYFLNPFRIPHCIKTLFGHGVYTRHSVMLFNMNLVVKNWYS